MQVRGGRHASPFAVQLKLADCRPSRHRAPADVDRRRHADRHGAIDSKRGLDHPCDGHARLNCGRHALALGCETGCSDDCVRPRHHRDGEVILRCCCLQDRVVDHERELVQSKWGGAPVAIGGAESLVEGPGVERAPCVEHAQHLTRQQQHGWGHGQQQLGVVEVALVSEGRGHGRLGSSHQGQVHRQPSVRQKRRHPQTGFARGLRIGPEARPGGPKRDSDRGDFEHLCRGRLEAHQ
mmetsp:Transcript_4357/g.18430  ORF Transcript_4357/g.18430 Transcript_4357/m.18430 type:complete len:238 (-) Transcript_4357:257-970(-)